MRDRSKLITISKGNYYLVEWSPGFSKVISEIYIGRVTETSYLITNVTSDLKEWILKEDFDIKYKVVESLGTKQKGYGT